MDQETKEALADIANALIISVGTLAVEMDRKGVIEGRAFTQLLRRKVFDAVETGAPSTRRDLEWIRYLAEAVDGDLQ